jgi:hypothetical protein
MVSALDRDRFSGFIAYIVDIGEPAPTGIIAEGGRQEAEGRRKMQ